jgi:hypothetical protein
MMPLLHCASSKTRANLWRTAKGLIATPGLGSAAVPSPSRNDALGKLREGHSQVLLLVPGTSAVPIFVTRSMLTLVLAFVAFPTMAADAVFRSGLEYSICDTSAAEIEPNDTSALAAVVALDPSNASAMICGAIDPSVDVDFFGVTIANTSTVLIETIRADGAPCDPTLPMSLKLFDSATTLIAADNNGGVGGCASLDGVTSPMLRNLASGNYYIEVDSALVVPVYALSIRLL